MAAVNISSCQKNYLKLHSGVEIPVGFFGDAYKTGFGIHLTDYYRIANEGDLVISVGIGSWKAKNADIRGGLSQFRVGYRQFITNGLYLQADGGLAKYVGNWGRGSRFTFGGGPGYLIKLKERSGVDLHFRINRVPTRTWLIFGAGYQFKF
jgi:hypothetical protein